MNERATDCNQTDEGVVVCDVSDEALEAAADADNARAMTWVNCSHVWWCWPL